jgi:hypothetical protein
MTRRQGLRRVLGGLGLALLFTAAPAGANECAETCNDARTLCQRAAVTALSRCRGDCGKSVEAAVRGAVAACREQKLGQTECGALVRAAVTSARSGCAEECQVAFTRARGLCSEAVKQCREVCDGPFDPPCVADCRQSVKACSERLERCTTGCREQGEQALQACRPSGAAPEDVRACIQRALADGRDCTADCHDEHACFELARECVQECRSDATPAP